MLEKLLRLAARQVVAARPARWRHGRARRGLGLECLEARDVPTVTVLLDFDGATAAQTRAAYVALPGWQEPDAAHVEPSFVGELDALNDRYGGFERFRFLDVNADGRLDRADGDLLARFVINQVRRDFAAYDVRVSREDDTARALTTLDNGIAGDALIFVTGYHEGGGGQAPFDPANHFDDVGGAGASVGIARMLADAGWSGRAARDLFVNAVANVISHEVGHTFGLDHVDVRARPDAVSLMTPSVGFDDLNFPDVTYQVEGGGTQNAHRELLGVLGASSGAAPVDAIGPRVTHSPSYLVDRTGPVTFRITFSEAIDPSTFAPEDVTVTGPDGRRLTVDRVRAVAGTGYVTFEVTLAGLSGVGRYALQIGPEVEDLDGNRMDQDGDGANGEPEGDRYRSTFTVGVTDFFYDPTTQFDPFINPAFFLIPLDDPAPDVYSFLSPSADPLAAPPWGAKSQDALVLEPPRAFKWQDAAFLTSDKAQPAGSDELSFASLKMGSLMDPSRGATPGY
jgi:hypothetical protein